MSGRKRKNTLKSGKQGTSNSATSTWDLPEISESSITRRLQGEKTGSVWEWHFWEKRVNEENSSIYSTWREFFFLRRSPPWPGRIFLEEAVRESRSEWWTDCKQSCRAVEVKIGSFLWFNGEGQGEGRVRLIEKLQKNGIILTTSGNEGESD